MTVKLIVTACGLLLVSCASYRPPEYRGNEASFARSRTTLRLDMTRGHDHKVYFAVTEAGIGKLSIILFTPQGATILQHVGTLPPTNDELQGDDRRMILDFLVQLLYPKTISEANGWQIVRSETGGMGTYRDALTIDARFTQSPAKNQKN